MSLNVWVLVVSKLCGAILVTLQTLYGEFFLGGHSLSNLTLFPTPNPMSQFQPHPSLLTQIATQVCPKLGFLEESGPCFPWILLSPSPPKRRRFLEVVGGLSTGKEAFDVRTKVFMTPPPPHPPTPMQKTYTPYH